MTRMTELPTRSTRSLLVATVVLACMAARPWGSAANAQDPRDHPQPVPTGTSSLTGRVSVLTNQQLGPVRRARVTLESAALPAAQTTDTDTEGRYRFINLPAGTYRVNADKPGFVLLASSPRRAWDIKIGQSLTADVVMARGAALEGHVLVDNGDSPAGIVVSAIRFVYGSHGARPVAVQQVKTDGRGRYRLHTLPAGEYYIDAAPDPRQALNAMPAPSGLAHTYYPGTPRPSDAHRIALTEGEEVLNLDFTLTTVPLAAVSVTVADSSGQRPASYSVRLQPVRGAPGGVLGFKNPNSFEFRNVTPDDYWVLATAYSTPAADPEFAVDRVTVAGHDLSGLSLTTAKGASLNGRVEVDGASAPLPASVQLVAVETEYDLPAPQGAPAATAPIAVGADGAVTIHSLFGPRLIRLIGLPATWALKGVWLDDAEITDAVTDFGITPRPRALRIVVTPNTASISGTVDDARGGRATVARVVIFGEDERQWGADSRVVKTVEISAAGEFTIEGLLPGNYLVAAVESLESGAWFDPVVLRQLKLVASFVTLTEHQKHTIALKLR